MSNMCNATSLEGILLGMGNPLLDISANVPEEVLSKYGLKANDAILAEEKHLPLYAELCDKYSAEFIPGGATQNAIRIANWILSGKKATSFIGCVGKDKYSDEMIAICDKEGINASYMIDESVPTGTCAVLIKDQDRSLVAHLSAANNYKLSHIEEAKNWAIVEKAQFFYIAGFFLTVSVDTIMKVFCHAAEKNKVVSMNLSAPFLCQFFKDPMLQVAPYWDIVFGNETEAASFAENNGYETTDLKEIAKKLAAHEKVNSKRSRVVVFTQGSGNTIVCENGEVTEYPVTPLAKIVDTNAAGDAFVGGFLAKYVQGKPVSECVDYGHKAAGVVIAHSGCTFPATVDF